MKMFLMFLALAIPVVATAADESKDSSDKQQTAQPIRASVQRLSEDPKERAKREAEGLQKGFTYAKEKPHHPRVNFGDVFLGVMTGGTAAWDVHETFYAKNHPRVTTFAVPGGTAVRTEYFVELHPVMRPVIDAGPGVAYPVQGLANSGVMFASYKLRRSDKKWQRVAGWVLPIAYSASHGYFAKRNHDMSRQPQ